MKISITTAKNDDFKILEGTTEIADFKYLTQGQIMEEAGAVYQGNKISIFPRTSLWGSFPFVAKKANLLKDNITIGEISCGGRSRTIIRLNEKRGVKKKFRLIPKGLPGSKYILLDDKKTVIFELHQNFNSQKLKKDYEVHFKSSQLPKVLLVELLMYSIYCAKCFFPKTVSK